MKKQKKKQKKNFTDRPTLCFPEQVSGNTQLIFLRPYRQYLLFINLSYRYCVLLMNILNMYRYIQKCRCFDVILPIEKMMPDLK